MSTGEEPTLTCRWCGERFVRTSGRGPAPQYCGDAHRQAAHRDRRRPATSRPGPSVWARRDEIIELAAAGGAHNVRVFGSVACGNDTATSDVDLLADLDPNVGLLGLIGLERAISNLLKRDVDVVPARNPKSGIRDRAYSEAVPPL